MQQSLRQASIRTVTGTTGTYEEDWHSLFTRVGVASGTYNERLLAYINQRLGTSYTELNGAMAALAAAESADNFQALGTFDAWMQYNGAAVHLDFVNRKYYWNGAERLEADFTTFTGASFGTGAAAGLTGSGTAASHDISLTVAAMGISAPFTMATVIRPTNVNSSAQVVARLHASATPDGNHTSHQISATNLLQHQTAVASANQALQSSSAISNDTTYAISSVINTNIFYTAINGSAVGSGDLSGSIPTHHTLRLLENAAGTAPYTGAIRHILFFQHTGGSEPSNDANATLSAALAGI